MSWVSAPGDTGLTPTPDFDLTEISDAQYFAHLITIFSTREQADRGAHVQYFNQVREWQVLYLHTPFEWY